MKFKRYYKILAALNKIQPLLKDPNMISNAEKGGCMAGFIFERQSFQEGKVYRILKRLEKDLKAEFNHLIVSETCILFQVN